MAKIWVYQDQEYETSEKAGIAKGVSGSTFRQCAFDKRFLDCWAKDKETGQTLPKKEKNKIRSNFEIPSDELTIQQKRMIADFFNKNDAKDIYKFYHETIKKL